jgi:hypothetical protein
MNCRRTNISLERIAVTAIMILALVSFGMAALLPVYTDEIVWKVMQGRLGYDGFEVRSGTMVPSCGPDAFTVPPLLLPFRLLETLMYQWISEPLMIRLVGIGFFIAWLVGTWLLLQRFVPPLADRWTIAGALVAFVTLGVMPFLMVISRPEQLLLIGITALLTICMGERPRPPRSLSREAISAIVLVFGSAMLLAAHQRAIFALPLMALAALKLLYRRAVTVVAILAMAYFAVTAYVDSTIRWACPGDPSASSLFEMASIGFAAGSGHLLHYLAQLMKMLLEHPAHFFFLSQIGFLSYHTSYIIPGYPWHWVGLSLTMAVAAFVGVMSTCGFCAFLVILIGTVRQHRVSVEACALASVWALLFASLFARLWRSDYEETLVEPLLGLVSILSIWVARDEIGRWLGAVFSRRVTHSAFSILLLLSIVSQVALIAGYSGYAVGSWVTPGYAKGQKWSVANFGYGQLRSQITETAAACVINPDHAHHLVVDELTFFALRQAHQPFLMTYLDENLWGWGISDVRALLTREQSAGMVVGCQWVPSTLRSEATVNGPFCCIPAFVK